MSDSGPTAPPSTPQVTGRGVVVSLGSNLGDRAQILRNACARLRQSAGAGFRASSLWSSTPVDCPPGSPLFLNAVVLFEPRAGETPETLLRQLQQWERDFGRTERVLRNEPRLLDLDLIAFAGETRSSRELTLPHPRAHLRRFVLEPLVEIAPDFKPPGWPGTAREQLACLNSGETLIREAPMDAA